MLIAHLPDSSKYFIYKKNKLAKYIKKIDFVEIQGLFSSSDTTNFDCHNVVCFYLNFFTDKKAEQVRILSMKHLAFKAHKSQKISWINSGLASNFVGAKIACGGSFCRTFNVLAGAVNVKAVAAKR